MQTLIISIIITILSLFFLIKGADWLLDGAIYIARKRKISALVIGSTIVAVGTVLPTIAVNLALLLFTKSGSDIAMGNMIGTNYVNLGLALGIPAFMTTIITKYNVFEKEIPLYLAISGLLTSFALDRVITRIEGFSLFFIYIIILLIIYQYASREKREKNGDFDEKVVSKDIETAPVKPLKAPGLMIALGIVVLVGAAFALTIFAPQMASAMGISSYIVGLTIVGVGTSLPTIVASIKAAQKNHIDIILGNVFGGNIVNIGIGLGFPAIFRTIALNSESVGDIYLFNFYNIVILLFILVEMRLLGKNKALSRVSGIVIVTIYLVYVASKIVKI